MSALTSETEGRKGLKSLVYRRTVSILAGAVLLAAGVIFTPAPARAQSVESLQNQIEELQKALDAVKGQLDKVQKEQASQKARMARQEEEAAPLKEALAGLSKVNISGGATGVVQGTIGVPKAEGGDDGFAEGSFNLVFEYEPLKDWKVVLDLEAVGGDGPDNFSTLHGINDDAGTTDDNVTILEAYLEGTLFGGRLTLTAGKIDATNYIDGNAYANDETAQFLSSGFVNNGILPAPDNAAGVRARIDVVPDFLYLEGVAIAQDDDSDGNTSDRVFEHVFGGVEIGVTPKLFGRPGNYRFWGTFDGEGIEIKNNTGAQTDYTAMAAGVSLDQEITEGLGVFFRIGYRDSKNLNYTTQSAWSLGAQLNVARIWAARPNDVIGVALGEIKPTKRSFGNAAVEETLVEAYYNWYFSENFQLTADWQFFSDRNGDKSLDDVSVIGLRLQTNF